MVAGVSPTGQMEPIGEEILVGGVCVLGQLCVWTTGRMTLRL